MLIILEEDFKKHAVTQFMVIYTCFLYLGCSQLPFKEKFSKISVYFFHFYFYDKNNFYLIFVDLIQRIKGIQNMR